MPVRKNCFPSTVPFQQSKCRNCGMLLPKRKGNDPLVLRSGRSYCRPNILCTRLLLQHRYETILQKLETKRKVANCLCTPRLRLEKMQVCHQNIRELLFVRTCWNHSTSRTQYYSLCRRNFRTGHRYGDLHTSSEQLCTRSDRPTDTRALFFRLIFGHLTAQSRRGLPHGPPTSTLFYKPGRQSNIPAAHYPHTGRLPAAVRHLRSRHDRNICILALRVGEKHQVAHTYLIPSRRRYRFGSLRTNVGPRRKDPSPHFQGSPSWAGAFVRTHANPNTLSRECRRLLHRTRASLKLHMCEKFPRTGDA
mmetsp:Transcript_19494/g.39743  ORF Transcript_19494/g.39743 Transcript_19494/m.39743 type:complete len:306 (+) Transcript_19494:471-1388(+)